MLVFIFFPGAGGPTDTLSKYCFHASKKYNSVSLVLAGNKVFVKEQKLYLLKKQFKFLLSYMYNIQLKVYKNAGGLALLVLRNILLELQNRSSLI